MSEWRDIIIAIKATSAIIACIICIIVGLFMAEGVESAPADAGPSIDAAAQSGVEGAKQRVIDVGLSNDGRWLFTVGKGNGEAAILIDTSNLLISLRSSEDAVYALDGSRYVAELTNETVSKMISELMRGDG